MVCGVCVDVVDDCGIAFGVGVTSAVCFRVPAAEGVTLARSHARCSITKNGDQTVVGNLIDGVLCIICAEVAVVGQADGAGLVAEHGVEGGIVDHFDGRAGFVGHVAVRGCRPAEEDLPCGDTRIAVHNDRVGVLCVVLGIDNGSRITANIIGQLITGLAADLGIQVITIADLGIEVERRAVLQRPAVELLIFSDGHGRSILFGDRRAVRDVFNLFQRAFGCRIKPEGHGMDRGDPLGMEGDVLRRHGLAGEVIRSAHALLVVVPAAEDVAVHARGRGGRYKVCVAGNGCSVLVVRGLYLFAAADENEVIAVAGVVELRVVIRSTVFGSFLIGKTGNIILIILRDIIPCSGAGILVMKFIIDPILGLHSVFAGKDLYIVVGSLTAISGQGSIEACTAQRHGLDVDLICAAVIRGCPCTAPIVGRPFVADIRAILCGDAQRCIFLGAGKKPGVREELHLVHIALVFNGHDGGAVTGNGLLRDVLSGEALIRHCFCIGVETGFAELRLDVLGGVTVIVGVLLHVQDGVFHAVLRDPVCVDGGAGIDVGEVRFIRAFLIQIPAAEGVAGLGWGRRLGRDTGEELRGNVAAAVGLEGQPVAVLDNGVKDVNRITVSNLVHRHAISVVPADHRLIGTDRVGHVGRLNRITRAEGLAVDHALFFLVHEQDVLDFVEVGEDLDSSGLRNSDRLGKVEGVLCVLNVPAEELAFAGGRSRLGQILAIFDDLFINFRAAGIEGIGRPMRCIRVDHCRHRIHRRDCRNHSGNHYDSKQQCK